jgi:hypothetical protein
LALRAPIRCEAQEQTDPSNRLNSKSTLALHRDTESQDSFAIFAAVLRALRS